MIEECIPAASLKESKARGPELTGISCSNMANRKNQKASGPASLLAIREQRGNPKASGPALVGITLSNSTSRKAKGQMTGTGTDRQISQLVGKQREARRPETDRHLSQQSGEKREAKEGH